MTAPKPDLAELRKKLERASEQSADTNTFRILQHDAFALLAYAERLEKEIALLDDVAGWAQAVLTALNVGDLPSESLLHKKLRRVMIEFREKREALREGSEHGG